MVGSEWIDLVIVVRNESCVVVGLVAPVRQVDALIYQLGVPGVVLKEVMKRRRLEVEIALC